MPDQIARSQVAPLRTINLLRLSQGATNELEELVLAAKCEGMFYLDFTDHDSGPCPALVEDIYSLSQSIFNLSLEEKLQYDIDVLGKFKTNGYKPLRRNVGGIPGQRDGFESYTVPPSSILHLTNDPFPRPREIDDHWETLRQFCQLCRTSVDTIFQALGAVLNLPAERTFTAFHSQSDSTLDIIRMLKYAPASPEERGTFSIPQTAHTDMGSITILFSNTPGLQLCPRGSESWLYVEPQQNKAVVNLGDAINIWSNGIFQSALHRVASLPNQAMTERYSFGYLMRPSDKAPMCSLIRSAGAQSGSTVPMCKDWVQAKFGALRAKDSNHTDTILTGRETIVRTS